MAKSAKELKRASRQRMERDARMAGDPTDALTSQPFFRFIEGNTVWEAGVDNLAIAGLAEPKFVDDKPEDWTADWTEAEYGERFRGSIGRAERMVGLLLDAAVDFARTINTYKREAIDSAIAKIEASDLTDPEVKSRALAEVVRLTKMRDQLDKNVRWELPQWRVHHP